MYIYIYIHTSYILQTWTCINTLLPTYSVKQLELRASSYGLVNRDSHNKGLPRNPHLLHSYQNRLGAGRIQPQEKNKQLTQPEDKHHTLLKGLDFHATKSPIPNKSPSPTKNQWLFFGPPKRW